MTSARIGALERTAGGLATLAFVGSALGHLTNPRWMAAKATWVYSPWYQREIALFDLAHATGTVAVAAGRRPDPLHLSVVSLTALLLGLNHAAAIRAGDRGGLLNWAAAIGNTTSGLAGLRVSVRRLLR
jgi:hypothetical protein